LEYLGVPHDQPLKTTKQMLVAASQSAMEDAPSEHVGDLNAMFDEVNNLPADDPLRTTPGAAPNANRAVVAMSAPSLPSTPPQVASIAKPSRILGLLPAKVLSAFNANGGSSSMPGATAGASGALPAPVVAPLVQSRANGSVIVDAGRRVAVPSFTGDGLRKAIETASGLGLRVEPVGSGIAREQAPAAGTLVPVGTQVVVRFTR
jgi:cell division protein FtsI (penicillin-binding protein 3)